MGSLMRSLLICVLMLPALAAPASLVWAADGPVTLGVSGGISGRAREAAWAPLTVTVTNHGQTDLHGHVVARVPGSVPSQVSRAEYRLPVILPAGSQKTVSLPILLTLAFGPQVEFEHEGVVLARVPTQVTIMSKEIVLAGVLSDDPGAFQSLAAARVPGRQRVELIPLTAGDLPDDPLLLESLDIIAVGRFDSSRLSEKQRGALATWVGRGGLLVVSGGPEWRTTLQGLPESILPVAVSDTTRRPAAELAEFGGVPLSGTIPVAVGRLRSGVVLVGEEDLPLIVMDQSGRGHIVFLAFDVTLNPVHGWDGLTPVWEQLLTPLSLVDVSPANRYLGPALPTTGITGALERMPALGLPRPGLLTGLLLVYGLIVGPGLYLVLGRFDRREWAWGAVPAVALLTLGSLWLVGFRGQEAGMHHTVTVTEVMEDARAVTRTYTGIFAPARESLRFTLPAGHMASGLVFGESTLTFDQVRTEVRYDQQTQVEIFDPTRWGMKGFQTVGQTDLQGALEFQVTGWDGGRLTGTVTNRTGLSLTGVSAVTSLGLYAIGDLREGESRDLTLSIGSAGGSSPVVQFTRIFSSDPADMRKRDVLIHLFTQMRNAESPLQVTLFGWTEDAVPGTPAMRGLGRRLEVTNLLYARFMPDLRLTAADIPAGLIVGRLVNSQNGLTPTVTEQGMQVSAGIYWFEFVLPPLSRKSIHQVGLHFGAGDQPLPEAGYAVQMFNWKTREWVDLPVVQEQALPAWADLVPPNGVVSLRLEVHESAVIPLPSLSVKGVER